MTPVSCWVCGSVGGCLGGQTAWWGVGVAAMRMGVLRLILCRLRVECFVALFYILLFISPLQILILQTAKGICYLAMPPASNLLHRYVREWVRRCRPKDAFLCSWGRQDVHGTTWLSCSFSWDLGEAVKLECLQLLGEGCLRAFLPPRFCHFLL